jgi:hypothetical protein
MKLYTFDVKLRAAFTLEAASEEEAFRFVNGVLDDAATIHVFEGDPENPIDELCGEASLEAGTLHLAQIDGRDVNRG